MNNKIKQIDNVYKKKGVNFELETTPIAWQKKKKKKQKKAKKKKKNFFILF